MNRRCPGCSGEISRGATLCRDCRRRANAVGATVVANLRDIAAPAELPPRPRTTGQNRAYHGKCSTLARLRGDRERNVKQWALTQASTMFGREISSSADMNEDEMSDVLDLLDEAIAATEGDAG